MFINLAHVARVLSLRSEWIHFGEEMVKETISLSKVHNDSEVDCC